jgi:hypothetical protein
VQAGISPAVADAIAEGRRPSSMPPDEEAVYNFATELLETKQVLNVDRYRLPAGTQPELQPLK